ncbi:MAG TPA: glycosyltransferase, partial [Solirubrobacteraceae bacterium]|nr:glycosyltransferase [Solirubrobacteraceae bacterium]
MDPSIPTAHARAPAAEPTAGAIGAALVLVVHDRAALTLRALIALAGADNGVRFHTLLVDDGSSDATPAIAAGVSGDFTALREERPCGFAAGADAAVTLSRQPLVV